ncbi:YbaK/EbsC family protein [Enterococcus pallens]|uniref:Cys-tRNA(Pro)/Cys-tRNA(Cys) deacylase n=1 Tax=Enterococcus pallens ATCC BAA-351 TaxID=1158607 RepID=R2ST75_9ENTE|nr:YbaK/EbsC family protein [Enterococcus pallens]EOH96006.1 YbaK/EbsC protein [Enterococcus pallens ATCC BAA-351]EOU14729.1 YbaK/EbsC protein [Enterococcus pallens ATCC BAA-351]
MANQVEEYLTEKGIPFTVHELPVEQADGTAVLAEEPVDHDKIFKTLVMKGNKTGVVIAVVPLDARLDYKKAAKATGNRKIGLPPMEFVLEHTGYEHGANTPIGIRLNHPDYLLVFDESIQDYDKVIVSSGELGKAVELAASDLVELLHPEIENLLK